MRTDAWIKAALGAMCICAGGTVAGMGLANYVASGSFEFYRQSHVAAWQAEPPAPLALETGDLAAASYHRSDSRSTEPMQDLPAFID